MLHDRLAHPVDAGVVTDRVRRVDEDDLIVLVRGALIDLVRPISIGVLCVALVCGRSRDAGESGALAR